jgi:hypothetical protein
MEILACMSINMLTYYILGISGGTKMENCKVKGKNGKSSAKKAFYGGLQEKIGGYFESPF